MLFAFHLDKEDMDMQGQITLFNNIQDVRSEAQANRKIAYDMGEKIGGARKDIYALRKAFEEKQTEENLQDLENVSAIVAAEMVTRNELFKNFSLKDEYTKGTDPVVARIKQLLIQRIDKFPVDSTESRQAYFRAAKFIDLELEHIYTLQDLVNWIYKIRQHIHHEKVDLTYMKNRIRQTKEILVSTQIDEREKEKAKLDLEKYSSAVEKAEKAKETPLSSLGKKFCNFFLKSQSSDKTINNVMAKVKTWDDLLSTKKSSSNRKKKNKPVWERKLPDRPDRIGGKVSDIRTGEQLMSAFNFRAIEFGNWTNDDIGADHLFRSSEAFYDLVDVLEMNHNFNVSLNGSLAMAYGSRGRGRALGHYEPNQKVINLTRNRGSLGIMAHEWFHAMDNWLYDISYNHKNGMIGYMTSLENIGEHISPVIKDLFGQLIKNMKEGRSIIYIDNTNRPEDRWRISSTLSNLYRRHNGDIKAIMNELKEEYDKKLENHLSFLRSYRNKDFGLEREKAIKKSERGLKRSAQALAWLHEQETGERINKIPFPTNKTEFLSNAIQLDRGKEGKYWSSNVELAARAFEAYIADKLDAMNRRNDYLVCGTHDHIAFPLGEERKRINSCFEELFALLRQESLI